MLQRYHNNVSSRVMRDVCKLLPAARYSIITELTFESRLKRYGVRPYKTSTYYFDFIGHHCIATSPQLHTESSVVFKWRYSIY